MLDIELVQGESPIKTETIEQRTDEWFKARLGKITGSKFDLLMPSSRQKETEFNDTQIKYLKEKAVEILTGQGEEPYSNQYMQWGTETEPLAKRHYELENFVVIQDVGFYQFGDNFGDSPDGITDDRCIEIKCPKSTTHLDYLIDPKKLLKNYQWQCYGHMIATGLRQCDLFSFDPRFPDDKKMVVVNIQFEQDKADLLMQRLELANQKLKEFLR